MTDDTPISYEAAARGTPVLSSAGARIGTLEHVLEVPEVDVFDGIVIATKAGLRFIDADDVQQITRTTSAAASTTRRQPSCRRRREPRCITSMRWPTPGTASTTSSAAYSAGPTGSARMTTNDQNPC